MIVDDRRLQDWKVIVLASFAFIAIVLGTSRCSGAGVDQLARWNSAEVRKIDLMRADKAVALYERTKSRYESVAHSGVPPTILFCLHYRESDNNFHGHAHNGDPLTHRTYEVPKGRLPLPAKPPFTFEQSAEDAYYFCDKLQLANWASVQSALDRTEMFNGLGYRSRGIVAPYNFSGTTLYLRGKFIRDHVFSKTAVDDQLGVATILKRMQAHGITIPF